MTRHKWADISGPARERTHAWQYFRVTGTQAQDGHPVTAWVYAENPDHVMAMVDGWDVRIDEVTHITLEQYKRETAESGKGEV